MYRSAPIHAPAKPRSCAKRVPPRAPFPEPLGSTTVTHVKLATRVRSPSPRSAHLSAAPRARDRARLVRRLPLPSDATLGSGAHGSGAHDDGLRHRNEVENRALTATTGNATAPFRHPARRDSSRGRA